MVSQKFYKWIHVFEKKASKRILMKKLWNHAIEMKKLCAKKREGIFIVKERKREDI